MLVCCCVIIPVSKPADGGKREHRLMHRPHSIHIIIILLSVFASLIPVSQSVAMMLLMTFLRMLSDSMTCLLHIARHEDLSNFGFHHSSSTSHTFSDNRHYLYFVSRPSFSDLKMLAVDISVFFCSSSY